MSKQTVTIEEAVQYLNELIALDRDAMTILCMKRVKCNDPFANHPTVQVLENEKGVTVGMVGILNGLFGIHPNGWGNLVFVPNDRGLLERVEKYDPGKHGKTGKE